MHCVRSGSNLRKQLSRYYGLRAITSLSTDFLGPFHKQHPPHGVLIGDPSLLSNFNRRSCVLTRFVKLAPVDTICTAPSSLIAKLLNMIIADLETV